MYYFYQGILLEGCKICDVIVEVQTRLNRNDFALEEKQWVFSVPKNI
jgi:hypothetical protein